MSSVFTKFKGSKVATISKVVVAILIFVAVILGGVGFIMSVRSESTASVQKLDEGWDIVINDSIYEDVNLSTFRVPDMKKGDTLILKNSLPDQMDSNISCFMFLIYLSAIDIKVDDSLIYSYGEDKLESGFVGSGYHFIQLPYGCEGKEVTIIVKPAENNAFTNIPAPTVVPTQYAPQSFTDRNVGNIFICVFLFMLGVVVTLISTLALFYNNTSNNLTIIGVLSILIGGWALCNTKVLQMFSIDLEFNTSLEYICLFVAPIPLLALLVMVRRDQVSWKKKLLVACMFLILVFDVVSTILHFTNIAHYPSTLATFHFLAFASIAVAAIAGWKKFSEMERAEKVLNIGILTLCAFAGIDIVRFNLSKYIWPENESFANSILPFGMFVFIIILIASYLASLLDMIKESAETEALAVMAYTDPLTGLYNRAKAEETFTQLVKDEKDYFLINMDLNGLKRMNDRFGHEKGDLLITSFAGILKECFSEIGIVVRMGGDEFLVVIDSEHEEDIKPALTKMIKLEAAKTKETGMRIETSFGISSNIEDRSRNPEQVYSIADSRMYAMKQKSKTKRQD